jgi:hypothetical protein
MAAEVTNTIIDTIASLTSFMLSKLNVYVSRPSIEFAITTFIAKQKTNIGIETRNTLREERPLFAIGKNSINI